MYYRCVAPNELVEGVCPVLVVGGRWSVKEGRGDLLVSEGVCPQLVVNSRSVKERQGDLFYWLWVAGGE